MTETFEERIRAMNKMYKLPMHDYPCATSFLPSARLQSFKRTLAEEVEEIDLIVKACVEGEAEEVDVLTQVADLLGDVVVYCRSEALRWGIPLEEVLDVIMDSNESKLGADGEPIYNADGKFMKGPNYWKPEPKIKKLLESKMEIARRRSKAEEDSSIKENEQNQS